MCFRADVLVSLLLLLQKDSEDFDWWLETETVCAVPAGEAWNANAWAELGGHVEETEDLLFHGDVFLMN